MRKLTPISRFAIIILLINSVCFAEPPTEERIDTLSEKTNAIVGTFLKDTLEERLLWHHTGTATQSLRSNSSQAYTRMNDLYQEQQTLLKQIEEYEGDDWDERYGRTQLWNKAQLNRSLCEENLLRIQLWQAISSPRHNPVSDIDEIINYPRFHRLSVMDPFGLIKSLAYAAKVKYDPAATEEIEQAAKWLQMLHKWEPAAYFFTKLLCYETNDLNSAEEIHKSYARFKSENLDDFELYARFALVLLKAEDDSILHEVLAKWPSSEQLFGNILLIKLNSPRETLEDKTISQIELATGSITAENSGTYKELIDRVLDIDKFHTPAILTNIANAQRDTEPQKAIANYLAAAEKIKVQNTENNELAAGQTAYQAAMLATRLFAENEATSDTLESTLDRYTQIAGQLADSEMVSLYVMLKGEQGKLAEAVGILVKHIKTGDGGTFEYSIEILTEIIEQIEYLNLSDDSIADCQKLAEHCMECTDAQSGIPVPLMLAEFLTYSSDRQKLTKAENLVMVCSIISVDLWRIEAKLCAARGQYNDALKLWDQIVQAAQRGKTESPETYVQWLQAKYYSILCYSRVNADSPEESIHAIEVLLNSIEISDDEANESGINRLEFWKNRLQTLKTELAKQKLDLH